jgi:hypothetical protein
MDYSFRMFEDNKEVSFDNFSYNELESICDKLMSLLDIDDNQITYDGDDDEKIILKNIDYEKIKNYLNKKKQVTLSQYGVKPWGKIEFLFEVIN